MEPDKSIPVVGLHHQKNDRWDDGNVRQHACNVIGHPLSRGCDRTSGRCGNATSTIRAGGSSVSDLCATHVAKSHKEPPSWVGTGVSRREFPHSSGVRGKLTKTIRKSNGQIVPPPLT